MRVLFLNQYFPPDPAPTGMLLREIADRLTAAGHVVDFVAARQEYRAGQEKGGRTIRELSALFRMLVDGVRKPRADVVLSATSPPCLLIVATLVAAWHRARSVHWIMDLYPEIAVALGEISEGVLASAVRKAMGWGYRRAATVVALDDDMADRLRSYGVRAKCIRPWVFSCILGHLPDASGAPEQPWTWIYSGNLGRAHEWETLLQAQALLEQRGADVGLLFQGGGPSWTAAQVRARELGLRQCDWVPYIDESQLPASLLRAEVLIVTQLPGAQGLLWPSKLALVLSLPRPILWVGPADGAIARLLQATPHAGVFAPGQAAAVADWLLALRKSGAPSGTPAVDPAAHRESSLAAWIDLLNGLV